MKPLEPGIQGFALTCPHCSGPLEQSGPNQLECSSDGTSVHRKQGIWRFLTAEDTAATESFVADYERVRNREGWGSDDPEYYRALPFRDLTGSHPEIWRIRAASFEVLLKRAIPVASDGARPWSIVDLGAGNCWLSSRLSTLGHRLLALDLAIDSKDGLGAGAHYESSAGFLRVQASFDHLPLANDSVDIAIFNGSAHYASDYLRTLREAKRIVRPGGHVVIMDTPVYRWSRSGRSMVEDRRRAWEKDHGIGLANRRTEAYLTRNRLHELGRDLGVSWQSHRLPLGWSWHLRPFLEVLRGRRELARFPVFVGRAS